MRFTLAVAAAVASLIAFPLAAQQAATSRATSSASNEGALSEVLVTARHREENIQAVPAAVSAISGEQLDASYTVNPQEISLLVPSLYYNSANPRHTAYTIRGLGSNTLSISSANDGIEPGVGFYVDQVYHGRPATAPDTGTGYQSPRDQHARSAELVEVDLHFRQDTVELRDISGSTVVRGDRKDAQNVRVAAIRETDIRPHPRQIEIQQADCRFHGVQQIRRATLEDRIELRARAASNHKRVGPVSLAVGELHWS